MRDIAVTLIVAFGCIYTFKRAYVGILLWSWLGYMNPHRLAFGFAYTMPFAQITGIVLFVSFLFERDKNKFPLNRITVVWIIFLLFMGLTTFFAYFPDQALDQYKKILKIQVVVILTMFLINDFNKLKHLIWVIVLSIGYFSVKGGLFTILHGGSFKVWGPPGTFIEDNNGLAIAVLMVIPFMIFLQKFETRKLVKYGLLFAILTSFFTVLGSQSRGALLAIGAVTLFYWIRLDNKIRNAFLIMLIAIPLALFMPESWYNRMDTIQTYEEDASAMGRINAWEYAYNAANHNPLGMGFESWSFPTFAMYAPNPDDVHAAHSIYFTVLGDHGWIGLILFLTIFRFSWSELSKLNKEYMRKHDEEKVFLCQMMQVSFISYFVGGAFLSLSYFDLPWHLISFVVVLTGIASSNNNITS